MSHELINLPMRVFGIAPDIWEFDVTLHPVTMAPQATNARDRRQPMAITGRQADLLAKVVAETVKAEGHPIGHGWRFSLAGGPVLHMIADANITLPGRSSPQGRRGVIRRAVA